jgi:hypothetical protein
VALILGELTAFLKLDDSDFERRAAKAPKTLDAAAAPAEGAGRKVGERFSRGTAAAAEPGMAKVGRVAGESFGAGVTTGTTARLEGLKGTFRNIGQMAAGFLAADVIGGGFRALTGFIGGSVKAGSDLGESINAVQKIFGSSSNEILAWGKANASSFGLSQRAFNELATPLGAFLKNAGLGMKDVNKDTIDLTKRAADLASVFNTDVSDAMEAIQSGLKGEQDPLERFGVSLSAAAVQAEAMRLGLVKTTVDQNKLAVAQMRAQLAQRAYSKALKAHGAASDEVKQAQIGIATAQDALVKATGGSTNALTKQQQTTAALSLIMNQTKDVQGDFASTSTGLANSQRIAAAQTEDLQAKIGQKLQPVVLLVTQAKLKLVELISGQLLPAFIAFGGWVGRNKELLLAMAVGIAAVLVPAFVAWATSASVAAAATIAAALPVILIAAAIGGLVFVIIKVVKHFGAFKSAVLGALGNVWGWIKSNWPYLLGMLTGPFGLAVVWVIKHWDTVIGFFKKLPGRLATAGRGMWDWIKDTFRASLNWLIDRWNGLEFRTPDFTLPFPPHTHFSGITIGVPDIPRLKAGGIVKARPGGTLIVAGEGGRDEAVVPLGAGTGTPGPGFDPAQLVAALERAVARALDGAEFRFERRSDQVLARMVRSGNVALDGL